MASAVWHKRLVGVLLMIFAILLFAGNGLLIWVYTGPRSLSSITPYIERALAPPGSAHKIKIGSSELVWDGWQYPIGVHAKNVELVNAQGVVIGHFPEIAVRMYLGELFKGNVSLKLLEVMKPTILLLQDSDGSIAFGLDSADENAVDNTLPAILGLMLTEDSGSENPIARLQSLAIRHATISVKKKGGDVLLQSSDATLEVERRDFGATAMLNMPLTFEHGTGQVDAELKVDKKTKIINAEVVYTDLSALTIQQLWPSQTWLSAIHMPVSGWSHAVMDFNGTIDRADFLLEGGPGTLEYASEFEKPLHLQRIRIAGDVAEHLTQFTIKEGLLDFKTFKIAFEGKALKQGDAYGFDGTLDTGNVPIDNLHLYWPKSLSPHSRDWVNARISKGMIPKAHAAFHFKPGDMALPHTPKEAIDAQIEVKDATIKYMPKHPLLTDVDGVVKFTGNSMDATVTHASYLSATQVTEGHAKFPDLNASKVRLFLDMQLTAPAKDVVEFMSLPDLNKAKRLNLTQEVSGNVSGEAKLDFIAFTDNDKDVSTGHINYDIHAKLDHVSQPNFMYQRDIADADMTVAINNTGLKVKGKARVSNLPMNIDLTSGFGKDAETVYAIQTDMPTARLPDFGFSQMDFVKGTLGVDAVFTSTDTTEKAKAKLDLVRASLDFPEHGFSKKLNEPATLAVETEQVQPGDTLLKSFATTGTNFSLSGKGQYNKKLNDFTSLNFDKLKVGRQDLDRLDYTRKGDAIVLSGKGRTFDVTPYMNKKGASKQSYQVNLNVDRLIVGPNGELSNAAIKLDCGERCRSADISAKLPSGTPFTYVISNDHLEAQCNNVGELIKLFGYFDSLEGGKMLIVGDYKEGKLVGLARVNDFTLKNAPVVTKIFTIASLTGILDTLTGHGIEFSKLTAPFSYTHNVITLKDAKAYGSALGITADGQVDPSAGRIDISGTLVPSYTINSLVGNIPLIGSLLVGGKGKGLVALNYSIKGDMKDPSVSVNPLSVLTPGFLRGIFNIFDKPAPDLEKIEADEKKKLEENKTSETPVEKTAEPEKAAPATPAKSEENKP